MNSYNINIYEPSSSFYTFGTSSGKYKFLRMPYSMTIASEVFQQKSSFNIEGVEMYIDDILIHSKMQEEHDSCLKVVFDIAKNETQYKI